MIPSRKYSDLKSCFITAGYGDILSPHLQDSRPYQPCQGKVAGSTVVSAVPSLRELSRCQIPRNEKMLMFQRGHVFSWKICLAVQVVFKNVNCYFCAINIDFLKKIHSIAKPKAVSGYHVCVDFGMSVLMSLKVTTVAKPFQRSSPFLYMYIYIYGGFYKWRCTPETLDGLFPGKSHLEMDEYPYFRKPPYNPI